MTKEKHGYIYYRGVHVRELVRASIRILKDTWIPNHPTNKVLHAPLNIDEEMMVSELLDPDCNGGIELSLCKILTRRMLMQFCGCPLVEDISQTPLSGSTIKMAST